MIVVTTRLLGLLQETNNTKVYPKRQGLIYKFPKFQFSNKVLNRCVLLLSCSQLPPNSGSAGPLQWRDTPAQVVNHRHLEDRDSPQPHTHALNLHTHALNLHPFLQTKRAEPTSPKRVRHRWCCGLSCRKPSKQVTSSGFLASYLNQVITCRRDQRVS